MSEFIKITEDNIEKEHLCCIIREKKPHPGMKKKRAWLLNRLKDGHVFLKLNEKATVFIEYEPIETAWVPISGRRYLYIHCLWVLGEYKGKGYGTELMKYAIADAKAQGKAGLCMLGAKKQKAWFSDQSFAEKFGFAEIDSTPDGYKLFALSFDKNAEKSALPSFTPGARLGKIANKEPTIFYTPQCPYTYQAIENAKKACEKLHLPLIINEVKTSEEAKELPCAFNNFALFFNGIFQTPNLPDEKTLLKIFSASTK